MTGTPADPQPPNASEQAAPELRRRRCDNCPKFFQQTKVDHRFCTVKCRREFHRNGAGFGKLKDALPKWIAKEVAKQLAAVLAQLPPPGPTHADVNNLLLEYDFVSRQEITPEGLAIVRAAGKKKRAAVSVGAGSLTRPRPANPPAPCNICHRPNCPTPNEKH
jgi:hypothetical protein